MATSEPIRSKNQVRQLADYYLCKGQLRNYVLVVIGVHTALRISDLLRLRWEDVYDLNSKSFKNRINITEQKTGKTKTIALNKQSMDALKMYFYSLKGDKQERFLFPSNRKNRNAISRIQAYRIIRAASDAIGMKGHISCHSLRKTFGYHAWKSGVQVALIMDIYNHSSFAVTRRYLGISQDDRDKVYMKMQLF